MNARRLLAFDLDKTVLTADYELPAVIERAVKLAQAQGHVVTVLTGRPIGAAQEYVDQLGVEGPFSVNHGGVIYRRRGEVLRRRNLATETVQQLLEPYLPIADLDFSCIVDETLYVRDPEDIRWAWAHTQNRRVLRYDPATQLAADKVVFAADPRTERLQDEIRERNEDLITYLWGDGYLEVMAPGADKGTALEKISRKLGFAREDTIAFGDGLNDVTMLAWAGHGVAVGDTAHPDTVQVADERIPEPELGGVAGWLEANLGIRVDAQAQEPVGEGA